MKKKIKVQKHKRYDPRSNKKVDVSQYEREQEIKQFKKPAPSNKPMSEKLTKDSIGFVEWKILELIKMNDQYEEKTSMYDLFDELAFGDEDEDVITEKVQNLMSQGIIKIQPDKSFKPTKVGDRIFWEWYEEYDFESEDIEMFKDNPKKTEKPLTVKDLEKAQKEIDKQLKENIKFQKKKKA